MLINKEINISLICIVIYSITQIVAGMIEVTFSISFLLFGLLLIVLSALNTTKLNNYNAFITLNITLILMSIASILHIIGL